MFYEAENPALYQDTGLLLEQGLGVQVCGDGPPLVFIHGNCSSSKLFYKVIQPLAQWFKVVLIDLPGHGTLPLYTKESVMDPDCALRHCKRVMTKLGLQNAVVCGHDIGGALAVLLALDEKLPIRKLVLVNPCLYPGERRFELVRMNAFPGSDKAVCLDVYWGYVMGSGVVWNSWLDLREDLGRVRLPVLELASESEEYSESLYAEWLRDARGFIREQNLTWTVQRVMGTGWFLPLEKPQALVEAITGFAGTGKAAAEEQHGA